MARIRRLEIKNFRSIRSLDWSPSSGINCLIGPGDSGKSSILDAIDLCLGARRSVGISDTDFYALNVTEPIFIAVTVGGLPDELLSLEAYAEFLRAHDAASGQIEPEPRANIETVLTLRMEVAADLEPTWSLYSKRAREQGLEHHPWHGLKVKEPRGPLASSAQAKRGAITQRSRSARHRLSAT